MVNVTLMFPLPNDRAMKKLSDLLTMIFHTEYGGWGGLLAQFISAVQTPK